MEANAMTPDQLRALADEMEARPSGIDAAESDGAKDHPGYMRRIEIDGIALDVDMRAMSDIRTLRMIGEIQKGGEGSTFAAVELFDRILGDQREAVEAALSDADGYCPADAYCEFAVRIFEAVGAKN